jgi:hypothetical protein
VTAAARKDLAKVRKELLAQAPKGAAADPFEEKVARERRKAKKSEPVAAGVNGKVDRT